MHDARGDSSRTAGPARWRPWLAIALAVGLGAACDPKPPAADAGPPVEEDSGVGGDDSGTEPDAGPADAEVAPCDEPIAGTEPFGAHLSGHAEFDDGSDVTVDSHTESLDVFFPEGRRPGAPVWLSVAVSWPYASVSAHEVSLDALSGAPIGVSGIYRAMSFVLTGELVGPDAGARVTSDRNFAHPQDDVTRNGIATLDLCPDGGPPNAELRVVEGTLSPLTVLRAGVSAPWRAPPALEIGSGGATIPADLTVPDFVGWNAPGFQLLEARAHGAWPPGRDLEVVVDGEDVLGRAYAVVGAPEVLRTTDVVSDLSFETAPPAGATAGGMIAEAGTLRLGGWALSPPPPRAMVALPAAPAGAATLRVSYGLSCGAASGLRVGLVTSDGAATIAEIACDSGEVPVTLAVPGEGPLFLVFDGDAWPARPQWSPTYAWSALTVWEVAFE